MSTYATFWASADTMVGCSNILLSFDFGVVMVYHGETGQVCTSVNVVGVEEFLEFPARREEPLGDWIGIHHPSVGSRLVVGFLLVQQVIIIFRGLPMLPVVQ